jgi:hypothetical protein
MATSLTTTSRIGRSEPLATVTRCTGSPLSSGSTFAAAPSIEFALTSIRFALLTLQDPRLTLYYLLLVMKLPPLEAELPERRATTDTTEQKPTATSARHPKPP